MTDAIGAVFAGGTGNRFQFTANAYTNQKVLRVYLGAWFAKGRLDVSMSDGSAAPIVEYVDSPNNIGKKVITIIYKTASDNQVLTLKYTADTIYQSSFVNVTLQAGTLK